MIENELDNGPQEPPVESAKKNNTRTLVKRTLAIAGLALVVYFLYSIVHLFVSPDRNIQQIYLVPEDAAFIIQSSDHGVECFHIPGDVLEGFRPLQALPGCASAELCPIVDGRRGRHPECGNTRHRGPKQ